MKVGAKVLSYQKIVEKRLFFRFLLHANKSGVFGLINEKSKLIYIGSSSNVMRSLGHIISELANKTHPSMEMRRDKKKLRIILLEQTEELYISRIKWVDYFKSEGFGLYNIETRLPKYKIRTVVLKNTFVVQLQLITAGKRVLPIKDFSTQEEAMAFANEKGIFELLKMVRKK